MVFESKIKSINYIDKLLLEKQNELDEEARLMMESGKTFEEMSEFWDDYHRRMDELHGVFTFLLDVNELFKNFEETKRRDGA